VWQPEPGPAAGLRVCVVGDILLDVIVRLDGLSSSSDMLDGVSGRCSDACVGGNRPVQPQYSD
jgi:hypothetical protein